MPEMTPEKYIPTSVLVVMAHPDDIDFGTAGSVAYWVSQGATANYCIVTDGSSGSNDPNQDLDELVALRRQEQQAAADLCGVEKIYWLGYQDGTLTPSIALRRDITRLIRQLKPERIVTFDPETMMVDERGYINHPDHRATGEACLYAAFPSAESRPIFPELLEEGLEPHKCADLYMNLTHKANVYVDISDHLDTKLKALACHQSQLGEDTVKMVEGWSRRGGQKYDTGAIEGFRVMYLNREEENDDEA